MRAGIPHRSNAVWFPDFIDTVDSAAEINAYVETAILGLVESRTEDRDGNTASNDSAATEESPVMIIDYPAAMKRLGNDAELFREFVGFYDEDSKTLDAQIEQAIAASDAGQLHHAAHSLKGLAANLGGMRVVEAAFALEQTGKAGTLNDAPAELARLRGSKCRRLRPKRIGKRS